MTKSVALADIKNMNMEPYPALVWEDIPVLRPGTDFKDGHTYITVPVRENRVVKTKKGKEVVETIETIDSMAMIRDDGFNAPYTPEEVTSLGYAFPDNLTREKERRWSAESIKEFISGKSHEPNPAILHENIRKIYEKFVEFADEAYYDLLPLYIMGSYHFRHFQSLGYLHFNGTAASGKSQNLNILSALAFNSYWASSISPAALYRQIAGMPGTMLMDESESFEGERGEELRRILNAGYLDGATVKRTERDKNDIFQVVSFESYGPKAIASINPLEPVIGSRCLIVAMRPNIRTIPEFPRKSPALDALRDKLYLWAMYHGKGIAETVKEWADGLRDERAPRLIARQWQISQIYITIADYIDQFDGGDRCDRAIEFFNRYFAEMQKNQDATDRVRLVLKCLPRVLAEKTPEEGEWYKLKTIHDEILDRLEADQAEYYKTRNLSKHLEILGFREKRNARGGTQYKLSAAHIREEFAQRRVEPYPEDRAWLDGTTDYTAHTVSTNDIWGTE